MWPLLNDKGSLQITGTFWSSHRPIAYSWCFFHGLSKGNYFQRDEDTKMFRYPLSSELWQSKSNKKRLKIMVKYSMYKRISLVTFIYQWKPIKSANSYKYIENLRVNFKLDRIKKLKTHAPWPSSQDSVNGQGLSLLSPTVYTYHSDKDLNLRQRLCRFDNTYR